MAEYQARLHRADGTLTAVAQISAVDDFEAKVHAARLLLDDIEYINLSRDSEDIAVVRRRRVT